MFKTALSSLGGKVRQIRGMSPQPTRKQLLTGSALGAIAAFFISTAASGSPTLAASNALLSPITNPLQMTIDCDTTWNPNCTATVTGNVLSSRFYAGGRGIGPAATYNNICATCSLADGIYSTRLVARDTTGQVQILGPLPNNLKCDRTKPAVSVNLKVKKGIAGINPQAFDRTSGIATSQLLVDASPSTLTAYSDICRSLSLGAGRHNAQVTATDVAGNSASSPVINFTCK